MKSLNRLQSQPYSGPAGEITNTLVYQVLTGCNLSRTPDLLETLFGIAKGLNRLQSQPYSGPVGGLAVVTVSKS